MAHYTTPEVYKVISDQSEDPIVEWKTCTVSWTRFAITQKDLEFYKRISPKYDGKQYLIPAPTLCPQERQRRRLMQRNERFYYRGKCASSGKALVTNINPKLWEPVYSAKVWWSDSRDATDYAQEISQWSFFKQFDELKRRVPKIALMNDNAITSENCEYTYDILYCKDCYMTVEAISSKLTHYSMCVHRCENMTDCTVVYDSSNCIECTDSYNLYKCKYVQNSRACDNMIRWWDCISCSHCIGCVGLRNQKYHIFNKQYTKEEYEKYHDQLTAKLHTGDTTVSEVWDKFLAKQPRVHANLVRSEQSSGSNLLSSSQVVLSYDLSTCTKSKYLCNVLDSNNCYDIDVSTNIEYCLDSVTPDLCRNTCFSVFCSYSHQMFYSEMCHRCKNCFWCVWLKDKEYCIFNKQYTKEGYEKNVAKLIEAMSAAGEWGEFFPAWTSSFEYNISDAMQRYEMRRTDAVKAWYRWNDEPTTVTVPANIQPLTAETIERNPHKIWDGVLNQIIICEVSWKPYRITKLELDFYRMMNFSIPTKHPNVRHIQRMRRRNPREMCLDVCSDCNTQILSTYTPDHTHPVCCQSCYQERV